MAQILSPRSMLLFLLFLFSTSCSALAAVLGVDLGTEYIKAALVKPGIPLEIVLTKDSRRKETSAVAFKPARNAAVAGAYPERLYGSDAIALAPRFPSDVYPNLKTLLGLPTDDELVKEYMTNHPALQLESHKPRGTAAFKSKAFSAEEEAWMVEELLAMELQSVQRNAEALAGAGTSVRSAVITVPPFYTTEEKRAVELAADLVGIKVLSLISDGLAVGLNYATSRTFPNINEGGKPEYHMVFDMGAGSTSATIMKFQARTVKDVGKFNKTVQEVQVLGSGWDKTLGGDYLNYLIVDDMVEKFVNSPAAKKSSVATDSVRSHGRAMAKLLKEAERLRHILSANTETQGSFEGLYDDVDFRYRLSRAEFEKMSEAYGERVSATVQKALDLAELDISQLDSIILHGGASRTPFVQKALEQIAGSDRLRSNVNSDEAAVFGAGFRAADLSPSFKVKEIRVSDAAEYGAGMKWTNPQDKPQHQRLWTARSFLGAAPKEVTFTNHEDLSIDFFQQISTPEGVIERNTKTLTTKNLTTSVSQLMTKNGCLHPDIDFKVQLRLSSVDGEVEVVKATVSCEADAPEKEGSIVDGVKNLFSFGKKEQQPLKEGEGSTEDDSSSGFTSTTESVDTATTSSMETSTTTSSTTTTLSSDTEASTSTSAEPAESSPNPKKKQLVVIPIDFALEDSGVAQLPKAALASAKDRIKAFEASDRSRRQREETLNQLESFTYKVRDLLDNESFVAASTSEERSALEKKASDASEWLYEDGADAPREELRSRLKALKELVSPVEARIKENEERPKLVDTLKDMLKTTNLFIDTVKKQIAEAEAWSSSASLSATSETSSTVTAAPSQEPDDFAGLEDDETTQSSTTTSAVLEDRGPAPPLYTLEDLKVVTDLTESITQWLEEKLAEQDKLPETADPVLLVKDLTEKSKTLEQAGIDLAMKSVKNFETKSKKKNGSSTKKSSKSSKTSSAKPKPTLDFSEEDGYIKLGKDGKTEFTQEDLDELLRQVREKQENGDGKEPKPKHDEL